MGDPSMKKEYPDEKQRLAVAYSTWGEPKQMSEPSLVQNRFHLSDFKFQSETVEGDVMRGVRVCEVGEAKGHDLYLDDNFLNQVVKLAEGREFKVHDQHREEGKEQSIFAIVGKIFNFRKIGSKVVADLQLFNTEKKEALINLAKEAGEFFGLSIDFLGKAGKKLANGLKSVTCDEINSVDFAGRPAATSSLFSSVVDSNSKIVTSKNNSKDMTIPAEVLQRFGLKADATEAEINKVLLNVKLAEESTPEKSVHEKMREHLAEHENGEEFVKKFDELIGKDADENAEEEEGKEAKKGEGKLANPENAGDNGNFSDDKEEKKLSAIIEKVVAKQFSTLSKSIGIKPIPMAPRTEPKKDEFKFSAEQEKIIKDLKMSEQEIVQFKAECQRASGGLQLTAV